MIRSIFSLRSFLLLILFFLAIANKAVSQSSYVSFIHPFAGIQGNNDSSAFLTHSSIQPFLETEAINADNLVYKGKRSTLLNRKVFNEHLLSVKNKEYELNVDFLPDWLAGYDLNHKKLTGVNTRGFQIEGKIGSRFSFRSNFYENQAVFAEYVNSFIDSNKVIPGQGYIHSYLQPGYDFSSATGYFSYSPNKYFNFRFGHDKNFIGDGYRSLILSDNAFNYPFLKVTTNIWHIRYVNLYAQMMDFSQTGFTDKGIPRKYISAHYLDWNVSRKLSIGLYECIVWAAGDTNNSQGIELNYLNPIIFFRPVEFAIGSPNNALLGANIKYQIHPTTSLYGQLLLDEFKISELAANSGWWANKFGVQAGIKTIKLFGIPNLNALTELNLVKPFTYSHFNPVQNYAHYNQPLAHPLGANFYESVSILNYSLKRFVIRFQGNYAVYGSDSLDGKSDGQNVYKNYNLRRKDFGNVIGQGIKTTLIFTDIRIAYLLNPKTNLRIEAGYVFRDQYSNRRHDVTNYFTLGIRSSFRNLFYDF